MANQKISAMTDVAAVTGNMSIPVADPANPTTPYRATATQMATFIGSGITITDGTHTVDGATTVTVGSGLEVTGSGGNATIAIPEMSRSSYGLEFISQAGQYLYLAGAAYGNNSGASIQIAEAVKSGATVYGGSDVLAGGNCPSGVGGSIALRGGYGGAGTGGSLVGTAGAGKSTFNGGQAALYGGNAQGSGAGGPLNLGGGQAAGSGAGGIVRIYGGPSTSGRGGDVHIYGGAGGTVRGTLFFDNLPTSSAGLTSGGVWNNLGVLSIVS